MSKPRYLPAIERAKRDREIVLAVRAGETGASVAKRFGIHPSYVSLILKRHNARAPTEEIRRRAREHIIHVKSPGRPRLYADHPQARDMYLELRGQFPAAEAKRMVNEAMERLK